MLKSDYNVKLSITIFSLIKVMLKSDYNVKLSITIFSLI